MAEFPLGLLTFRIVHGMRRTEGAPCLGRATRAWLVLAHRPAAISCVAGFGVLWMLSVRGWDVAVVALFCVLVGALSRGQGLMAAALSGAVPYRLGRWSYSIYLLHDKFSHMVRMLRGRLDGHVPLA